ncbi:uncharacterized protein METZ01_LOCUS23151 [marine metagenome]|uniref:Uncharacterized protein n=1 Tax=marine metagenome TaxID=408172 RepID=A0A381PW58_9ZZZZ
MHTKDFPSFRDDHLPSFEYLDELLYSHALSLGD